MSGRAVAIITAEAPADRDRSLESACAGLDARTLLEECAELECFRRSCENLYQRVRALFFLYAIHRFHLPERPELPRRGMVPFAGCQHLLQRRFEEAIGLFLERLSADGPSDPLSSALAAAYHRLAFQTLANQVRRSVRSVRGNQWMFRLGHPADHPLRIRPELLERGPSGAFPILREQTPVRMDLTHSGWSDIFFLGMDFPEGARVLNVSIDLGVHGRDAATRPPVEAWLRVIDEPVVRLTSVDLAASADLAALADAFDFARDYLGLLKAAVIASGLIPPGTEGADLPLADLLARVVGPGLGLEIVSNVNHIPKGSRLAVSTNLLACLIAACMRATGQTASLAGPLSEQERRTVAARAILGEWLGGSGGGWQDSGGVWPGIKRIEGVIASPEDPEYGISRGRLLPRHHILDAEAASPRFRERLQESLVLVHGGMAQNVGPILEMVTEKYLLRSGREWEARQAALGVFDEVLAALRGEDIAALADATSRNFHGPIQAIIPWASNLYTETLIARVQREFGPRFLGFWMLGGMSGGGMGFIFKPGEKARAQEGLQAIMRRTKSELEDALPFAMDPVVYDFTINDAGTCAELHRGESTPLPAGYYAIHLPGLVRGDPANLPAARRLELGLLGRNAPAQPSLAGLVPALFERLLPRPAEEKSARSLADWLAACGFDPQQHERIREALVAGRIGLAQNRLPVNTRIEDVCEEDVIDARGAAPGDAVALGRAALANGEVAVLSLAAGAGSRWTQGAGVVKALHPFCRFGGKHRSFLELHLAKSRRVAAEFGAAPPHLFSTSYLTHDAIARWLERHGNHGYPGEVLLSPGRSIGLRLVPTVRDLHFAWEETAQQLLDEQAQKVRDSLHAALLGWARQAGEGSDYTDNVPAQCLHPVGHWYEFPNLLLNGLLRELLARRPQLRWIMLHNIDTVGAAPDPGLLGLHIRGGAALTFEVINRRIEDRGGGLARVDGRPRLIEGLAMPREEDEFDLSYYNSMTTWIDLDRTLALFGLNRGLLGDGARVAGAVRDLAARMPTYITLKQVKKRWGHGQEDVFPVTQFEKLWSDLTALPELACRFAVVDRRRGQQLKDQAQLDGWVRDGSAAWVESLCDWGEEEKPRE